MNLNFTAPLWQWEGKAAWFFVTVPHELSDRIRAVPREPKHGFGSVRVRAVIGATTFDTSVFPDSTSGCYLLPVKKPVRAAESLEASDEVAVTMLLLD